MSDFPSFDAFMSQYSPYGMKRWTDGVNEIARSFPVQFPLTENSLQSLTLALAAMNAKVTLNILRDYHEWLRGELERKSLRLL